MTRFAPLAIAGIVMAVLARLLGPAADRFTLSDPWGDIWYETGLDADDDPEPDAETLEAHARRVLARS